MTSHAVSYELGVATAGTYDVPRSSGREIARNRAAGGSQRVRDLVEEVVRADAEPEHGQSQHRVAAQRHAVVAQGIAHHLARPDVVDPVHLDDHAPPAPPKVQVVDPGSRT